jgi:hypothetical protein
MHTPLAVAGRMAREAGVSEFKGEIIVGRDQLVL